MITQSFIFLKKSLTSSLEKNWPPPKSKFLTPSRVFSKSFNVPLISHFRGVCACHAVALLLFTVLILLSYKWISWQKWFYFWRKKILQDMRKGRNWRRNSQINQFRKVTLSSWRIPGQWNDKWKSRKVETYPDFSSWTLIVICSGTDKIMKKVLMRNSSHENKTLIHFIIKNIFDRKWM